MFKYFKKIIALVVFLSFIFEIQDANALTDKYRCMWRGNPSVTMVVGWNQISGDSPMIYYGESDCGKLYEQYPYKQAPDAKNKSKGMNNHFVRLKNLKPNTIYYFVIVDSDGVSRRMSFQTIPNDPNTKLSIIAGGDSRNHRKSRQNANKLVAKLHPHFVMFGGDMTGGDIPDQWKNWFDDWQLTINKNGHLTPIVVARGNHERSNESLFNLFDLPTPTNVYAITFAKSLLRVYTLNSMIPSGGKQQSWLIGDLKKNQNVTWRFAQYHKPMRPHTKKKPENNEQFLNWAPVFMKYNVNLVVESDAHLCKTTWPIVPSANKGHEEGFIRDDVRGTVYLGEGAWGAPLRPANDNKEWTRASGSFNQFKWIFVHKNKIEVRTVKTDNANAVGKVDPSNRFKVPEKLSVWKPETGAVIEISRP